MYLQVTFIDCSLGVTIDSKLSFCENMTYLCGTAPRKLHALSCVSKYISLIKKRRIYVKSFIVSQSSYCPLIWVTHSRGFNNKINHIHERALRIVYKDFSTSFEGSLAKDKSVTIHNQTWNNWRLKSLK